MATSIFNPRKTYFDLMPIIGYINTPDLFIAKFLVECIKNYSDTNGNTACHLTYQQGHLNNKKLRNDFNLIFNLILDKISLDKDNIKKLKDSFIVALDNSSKSLSIVFEFNRTTTTVSIISVPLDPEKQSSVHTRKKIYDTFYLPGSLSIFNNDKYSLYTLDGKNCLLDKISLAKSSRTFEELCVAKFFIEAPKYSDDLDILSILKSEAINTINRYTGFFIKEDQDQDFNSRYISVLLDNDGFYLRIG